MRSENTKKQLLECGNNLISEKGYNGVGLKEILDSATVPKGSFYHYFKSKEDFVIEIIKMNFTLKHQFLRTILEDSSLGPKNRIKKLIEEYKRLNYNNDRLLVKMVTEMANLSSKIKEELNIGMDISKEILSNCLTEAQSNGEIDKNHNIDELCEFIFSGWEGAIIRSRLIDNNSPIESFFKYTFSWVLK